ncbi:hypothetical protein [Bizionia myxarmorum]|uniref:DUF4760 domain-containing protein n=1 Tax=Bizionia myxarmorum TaxID=291186 RepID=A0A5D0RCC6_9FLAO|nr:hypothetical protein [Bizionia myxarmorum]TYB79172.1 hypothetical protein ES674_05195 [Bizionia myxarmorum]
MKENVLFLVGILKDLAPLIISGVAIWLTSRYQRHAKKLANDEMMKDLFTEFNIRYDTINNKLDKISKTSVVIWEAQKDEKEKALIYGDVVDFFNICSEEYYWYKEGRLDAKIWKAWHKGMNDIYNRSKIIQHIWEQECKNEGYKSYYISNKNEIFKIN